MKISVIVPVYNMERYLDRCMASLLGQTYTDWEIILVDDGSTDASGSMCDGYAARPGVRAIHRENGGLGMARNTGLAAAAGEYALFVDPDDYLGPRLLENLGREAERTKADLIIGGYTAVGPDGREIPRAPSCGRIFQSRGELDGLLLHTVGAPPEEPLDSQYGVSVWARLYRLDVIRREQIWFVSERVLISEDLIFNMDFIRQAGSAVTAADASYFYCTNAGSLSKRHREDRFAQDYALYLAVRERLARWYPEEDCRLSLARLLISRARYDIIQETDYRDLADPSYPLEEKVAEILQNRELQRVLEDYPWRRLPKMQGIFAWFMKRRQVGALVALVRLKRRFLPGK